MANSYKVTIQSIATDGTNLFLEISISDGTKTMPTLRPVFPVGTSAADINAYAQAIANNQPILSADIVTLVNTSILGV